MPLQISTYMKKALIVIAAAVLFITGCKKYEQKSLPLQGVYILKGTHAVFYDNGVPEGTGSKLIIVSGKGTVPYGFSEAHDTLFKSLWAGDVLSITSDSYTSIYYNSGGSQGYLVDSTGSNTASVTLAGAK